ncbi:hypothetical protein CYLTODRAFT_453749 [Cylindrobasidium torrendii FP15055 ss-10]|uniref:Uncharacterized protein n=1 Tax=Cylindrobasidium torrendii FP15055 ss-10 TaxID=1314674 RepID=A0A0D7BF55_9AGAR|nr:hypothetical protein CYLTODRAFT_453749 [Cylindrobasidium torrendii FP15055 ss-10]
MAAGQVFEVTDCEWRRLSATDGYTQLRLLKDGWKSHDFKVCFSKRSLGGSTGWNFNLDVKHVYSIEVYKSSRSQAGLRRLSMDRQEYERRTLTYEDISKAVANAPTPTGLIPYVIEMGNLGQITLHIQKQQQARDASHSLRNAALLAGGVTASGILARLELLEPILAPLSTMGDIVSEVHPIAKGIVGTFRAIHKVMKSVSELRAEINDLLEEMCIIFRYVDKINSALDKMDTDLVRETLAKLDELMRRTCDFVHAWHAYVQKRGSLLASLSPEQIKGTKNLRTEFVRLQGELNLGMTVDVFLRTPSMSSRSSSSDSATAANQTVVSVQHEANSRTTTPPPPAPSVEPPNYTEALATGAGKAPYYILVTDPVAMNTLSSLSGCHYAQHNHSRPAFSRHQSSATVVR